MDPEMKARTDKMGFTFNYKPPSDLRRIMIKDYEAGVAIAITPKGGSQYVWMAR